MIIGRISSSEYNGMVSRPNTGITEAAILRKLGTFERALFLSDRHSPFNVVTVLRLEHAPVPELIYDALGLLQKRHPLLQAGIRAWQFERLSMPSFSFQVVEKQEETSWLDIVGQEMNTRLNPERGLFRATYVYNFPHGELFLTFHHVIMDAVSGMKLMDELLQICATKNSQVDELMPLPTLNLIPPVEEQFPASFQGLSGFMKLTRYAFAQGSDEIRFQWRMRGKRTPPVHLGGRGFPLTLILPETLVDRLSKRCRVEKVTLNSLLNASILLAANRRLYAGVVLSMRTFSFADLRPYTVPSTPAEHLANYISMLRFTMEVSGGRDIWELTRDLHDKIYRALKQGDKFLASRMSESLIKMFVGMKSMRMGATALNYSGAVPLQTQYGEINVKGLHAFLSSFNLGPEVSVQARLFNNELWMDFMFLETDMEKEMAKKIVEEVRVILEAAVPGNV
jgi:NRPS condensation-like uncharacterized protein